MRTTDAPPTPEELAALEALFKGMDRYFSESEERRRFMRSANGLEEKDLQILQAALASKLTPETAQKAAASADSPLRMAHALLELETTVKKSKDPVLLYFTFALLRSPKVTTGLDRLWFFPWEQALVLNKLLTQEQLRFIWQSKKEAYAKELVPDSMRLLARHRQCPADVLEEMLPRDDAMLRKIIGMHANTSSAITRFFVNSPRKAERLHMATSRHASSDVLLSLLRDKHDDVSRAARRNLAENLFKIFLGIALECNRDEWMLRMRRMGSCPCKQPGHSIARFHSNPSGKWLAGRSALLHRLPIARAIGCALRLAAHPGKALVRPQKDLEQVLNAFLPCRSTMQRSKRPWPSTLRYSGPSHPPPNRPLTPNRPSRRAMRACWD